MKSKNILSRFAAVFKNRKNRGLKIYFDLRNKKSSIIF